MKIKMAAAAVLTLAASALPTAAAHASTQYYLANGNSGRCLVVFANGSLGSRAAQYDCNPYADQLWYYNPNATSDNPTTIVNSYSGQCLTAQGNSNGAPGFDYTCTGLIDQEWYFVPVSAPGVPGNHYWLVNKNSGKCLVIQGPDNGNVAFQYTCDYYADQYWAQM
jgi:hypothetical protein